MPAYQIGSIVSARGREWIVQPGSTDDLLHLRPLAGSEKDDCVLVPELELARPASASFGLPDPDSAGDATQASLLRAALQMKLRNGAGPFRSFGNLAVEPRPYQFVPLLMALRLPVVRLLVADDVGLGKTVEAGLVLREFLDRGEIDRAAVLCPPHLVDQWVGELRDHFHIDATALTARTAERLERGLAAASGETVFSRHPFLVISLDYIKSERHREAFLLAPPSFVIVDEAHACATSGTGRQYRFELLRRLADDPNRHLLLLTGTPHSGDTDAFYNLLSLLKPEFAALADERADDKALRAELARHFVQRRRGDIVEKWGGADFFPERVPSEITYALPAEWSGYLTGIYEFCRDLANQEAATAARREFNGYTALALLRCASSSPAAAVKAFDTRLKGGAAAPADAEADEDVLGVPGLYDDADADSSPDAGADLARLEREQGLRRLRDQAEALRAAGTDPKLACLVEYLGKVLLRGSEPFRPIVFCRYVETAKYVGEALRAAFSPKFAVGVVTGEDNPDERRDRVAELVDSSSRRILVATDCLSEGINLQDDFDAVVHYDMVWNPTRHEQREGRVDRFGQRRATVRCALLYGEDNPVDGLVLSNIVRKAETIRRELGISVPVPVDDRRIKSAILQAFRMRRIDDPRQMEFDLFDDETPDNSPSVNAVWKDACERERKQFERNRTVFAQNAIHPEAVAAELDKTRALLGAPADVEGFVRAALKFLGAPLGPASDGVSPFDPLRLPQALQDLLREAGLPCSRRVRETDVPHLLELRVAFEPSAADRRPDVRFVRRTDPLVATLADFVVESALSGRAPAGTRPAARCAAMRTAAVSRRTVLLVQRLRHLLRCARADGERILVGEEIALFAAESGGPFEPVQPGSERARALFGATASADLAPAAVRSALEAALRDVAAQSGSLAASARSRADALLADHRAVRDAAGALGRYAVEAVVPADTIGLYVYLPDISL